MQYEVVWSLDVDKGEVLEDLTKKVNKLCQEGWKPQGGIFFSKDGLVMKTQISFFSEFLKCCISSEEH